MKSLQLADRLRLIVITDEALVRPRALPDVVREALAAGAPTIQLRLKDATARELFEAAQTLIPIVRSAGALFIVNDRLDVALAAGADGVHLGPDDPPIMDARAVATDTLGATVGTTAGTTVGVTADAFILGYSVDTTAGAARAEAEGADYLGVGAVYATAHKSDAGEVIGLEGLRRVVEAVSIPVVAIGGITRERAPAVAETGACGSAAIGAVMGSAEPAEAV
ncbi:MAG: thiamine phosphate synthase, partial [Longimicrobiales bacterium]